MDEDEAIEVIVRFASSQGDVAIPILSPSTTSVQSLIVTLRHRLSDGENEASSRKLRLIHAGKVLTSTSSISSTFAPISSPSKKQTGKLPQRKIYIHCSVGDTTLTPSELEDEALQAQNADSALREASLDPDTSTAPPAEASNTPRGFDRLLTAGFTPAEVAQLRTQFLAIQAYTHTSDEVPSGNELLALEERWLDRGGGEEGSVDEDPEMGIADMLYGNLIGFVWPLGALVFLREHGVWSRRRQVNLLAGVLVNLTFGLVRALM
ncbi:hypothetical protein K470DRAFT_212339 [Piedraia hortae CBS 480.64]|uniref:Ubiquitin-like domain-containing protein n=1 Tax=Piedraia hortae CBS 480.64 TaxID=1314780 RepID=A0A6A7C6D9_9PEZI|nr:hypothetical protein K470DRAFT_212339 [Piedraia hortae CBS 480.64]